MSAASNGWETAKPDGNRLVALDGEGIVQAKAMRGRAPFVRVYVQTRRGWAGMDVDASVEPPRVLATGVGRRKEDARDAIQAERRGLADE